MSEQQVEAGKLDEAELAAILCSASPSASTTRRNQFVSVLFRELGVERPGCHATDGRDHLHAVAAEAPAPPPPTVRQSVPSVPSSTRVEITEHPQDRTKTRVSYL